MTIQPSDLFLVSNGGSKKCEAQNLNGKTGNVLVNRGGVSHKTGIENIPATVLDTDLMLVNRGGASFKATGAEVQTLFPQGPAGGTDVIEAVVDNGSTSTLTLASDKNLDTFTPGDGLQMVDTDGNTAAYVPVTSAITAAPASTIAGGWTSATLPQDSSWYGLTYGGGKFVAVGGISLYSTDGINWFVGTGGSGASIAYGTPSTGALAGTPMFVSFNQSSPSTGKYSLDGITFQSLTTQPLVYQVQRIAYGNGTFVCVGRGSTNPSFVAAYSTDGLNWTTTTVPQGNQWHSVAYGAGKFVAVSYNGTNRVMYSADGISWTIATAASSLQWTGITYGGGKFVAVASNGSGVMWSIDGISWNLTTAASSSQWQAVTYGDGKFVAVAGSGSIRAMESSDAINWTASTAVNNDSYWWAVAYGGNKFVAAANGTPTGIMYSYTGSDDDETIATLALTPTSKDLKYFNPGDKVTQAANFGTVKSVGTDELVLRDTSAEGWTATTTIDTSTGWYGLAYGAGKFVALAYKSGTTRYSLMTSPDGITWTGIYDNDMATKGWDALAFADGRFVAVAQEGSPRSAYSLDGVNWTISNLFGSNICTNLAYGDNTWVASTLGTGIISYSRTGGDAWNSVTAIFGSGKTLGSGCVAYGDGKFVLMLGGTLAAPQGAVAISTTAANSWTAYDLPSDVQTVAWTDITYGDGKFVAVGNYQSTSASQMIYSFDGITWLTGSGAGSVSYASVVYADNKFVAVASGVGGTAWSTDGITWNAEGTTITQSNGWRALAYGDGKFVAVGLTDSTVGMYSETGTSSSVTSDWTTSVGQAAELDKPLSGAGTYDSHTGSVMTVNNSNTEWVDNDNQRGDNYYATTGTTRLALAKALTIDDYGVMTASARQWAATAIAGYYPLFRFERIAKLVGNGTAHSHTFDGVTWYMPNGVTYYHGDYNG